MRVAKEQPPGLHFEAVAGLEQTSIVQRLAETYRHDVVNESSCWYGAFWRSMENFGRSSDIFRTIEEPSQPI